MQCTAKKESKLTNSTYARESCKQKYGRQFSAQKRATLSKRKGYFYAEISTYLQHRAWN